MRIPEVAEVVVVEAIATTLAEAVTSTRSRADSDQNKTTQEQAGQAGLGGRAVQLTCAPSTP